MKHVYAARDEMDAHFVKGLLEQQGIEAVVTGANLNAAWAGLQLSDQSVPAVWVNDADEERAAKIVGEYKQVDVINADESVEGSPRPTWKCPNCGEAVEQQFTECWKCGCSRPPIGPVVDPTEGPH